MFKMGVFLAVTLMVLDQSATKITDKLPELSTLKPRLATKLLSVINGKYD